MMDIRFTNRWEGFSYNELYTLLDGLIGMTCSSARPPKDSNVPLMIHEINQELIKRQKEGGKYDETQC